jgi:hypothetical protein
MDPYIERPEIWPDFHDSLITYLKAALQPLLRPRYVALSQDRLYVVESERPIRPDVAVVRTSSLARTTGAAAAVLEADVPAVFELWREEIREPLIEIVEPAAGNRVVTAVEILSPDDKNPGSGRESYLKKREEFWASGTNLVEVDLLREGQPTVRISPEKLAGLQPYHYLVGVTRHWPARQEVYARSLRQALPRIAIPLAADDRDVTLDLQAVFTRCWDEGPYPELLRYDGPPLGRLAPQELAWCEQRLREAGVRPAPVSGDG